MTPTLPVTGFLLTHRAMGNQVRIPEARASHGCYSLTTSTSWQQTAAPHPQGHLSPPTPRDRRTGLTRDPTPKLAPLYPW